MFSWQKPTENRHFACVGLFFCLFSSPWNGRTLVTAVFATESKVITLRGTMSSRILVIWKTTTLRNENFAWTPTTHRTPHRWCFCLRSKKKLSKNELPIQVQESCVRNSPETSSLLWLLWLDLHIPAVYELELSRYDAFMGQRCIN